MMKSSGRYKVVWMVMGMLLLGGQASSNLIRQYVTNSIPAVASSSTNKAATPAVTDYATGISTTTLRRSSTSSTTSSASLATHTIFMGRDLHSLSPGETNASVGDIIEFQFFPLNHSVARAAWGVPCQPIEWSFPAIKGFWSGFFPMALGSELSPRFQVRVNDTDPIFFYCAAPDSCIGNKMIGVINPTAQQSFQSQNDAIMYTKVQYAPGDPIPSEGVYSPPTPSPTSSPATTQSASIVPSPSHSGLSTGAIAGIVVGGVAALVVAGLVFFLCGKVKGLKSNMKYGNNQPSTTTHPFDSNTPPIPYQAINDKPGVLTHESALNPPMSVNQPSAQHYSWSTVPSQYAPSRTISPDPNNYQPMHSPQFSYIGQPQSPPPSEAAWSNDHLGPNGYAPQQAGVPENAAFGPAGPHYSRETSESRLMPPAVQRGELAGQSLHELP